MADINQFGSAKPNQPSDPQHCAQCEAMVADALDGTLSPEDQATFDLHLVGCPACADMLAEAQRGAAWMDLLKSPRPEPSATLLERIIAQTSGKTASEATPTIKLAGNDYLRPRTPNTLLGRPTPVPAYGQIGQAAAYAPTNILPFRSRLTHGLRSIGHTMLQPRLAMTAAMAFFSIALTMNLTGVHLSSLRASDFKPSSIKRSCYETKARVVRYSDNLRVVYELESRVHDLQRSSDDNSPATQSDPASTPNQTPNSPDGAQPGSKDPAGQNPDQKQSRPRPKPGSSRRETPNNNLLALAVQTAPQRGLNSDPSQAFAVFAAIIVKQEGGLV